MTVALIAAEDPSIYGGKAVQLGTALRAGLPVPEGVALGWPDVDAVAEGRPRSTTATMWRCRAHARCGPAQWTRTRPDASFAGAHLTFLGVEGCAAVREAVAAVRASAYDPGALAYRAKLGLDASPRMAVVVQRLIDSDVAGVMFTRNPMTGADERVIEASWGLGEAVVAGLVAPDHWVLDASGQMTTFIAGEKDIAIRRTASGTAEEPVDSDVDRGAVPGRHTAGGSS